MTTEQNALEEVAESFEVEMTGRLHDSSLDPNASSFREQIFTELVCEYLVEYGATEDVETCFIDGKYGRGLMQSNAYSVNQPAGKVTIVTTIYSPEALTTIHRKDIELAVQRAVRVFEAAIGGHHESMEPATDAFSMVQRLAEVADDTRDLHVLVLTNGIAAGAIDALSLADVGAKVRWHVWDIVRLSRCVASGKAYESISIDLTHMPTGPLPCLKIPESEADYDAYLAMIPGELLYQLYDDFGSRLLELNVRSFLQARGKVNRGIRDTIRHEPERFGNRRPKGTHPG